MRRLKSRRAQAVAITALCVFVALGALVTISQAEATGPTPITQCGNDTELRTDVAAGGSYVFQCQGGSAAFNLTTPLIVSSSVTLDATGQQIFISDFNDRAFNVDGGTLTLIGGDCRAAVRASASRGSSAAKTVRAGEAGWRGRRGNGGQHQLRKSRPRIRRGTRAAGFGGFPGKRPGRAGRRYLHHRRCDRELDGDKISGAAREVGGAGGAGVTAARAAPGETS